MAREIFRVKIVRVPKRVLFIKCWYHDLVGKEFDVFERTKTEKFLTWAEYEVVYFGHGICKRDCETVNP